MIDEEEDCNNVTCVGTHRVGMIGGDVISQQTHHISVFLPFSSATTTLAIPGYHSLAHYSTVSIRSGKALTPGDRNETNPNDATTSKASMPPKAATDPKAPRARKQQSNDKMPQECSNNPPTRSPSRINHSPRARNERLRIHLQQMTRRRTSSRGNMRRKLHSRPSSASTLLVAMVL